MSNFYQDVIKKSPHFNSVGIVNDINLLEPITRAAALAIIAEAETLGHKMMIFETYRSEARQLLLFKQKATKLKQVGDHHYGIAFDIVKVVNGEANWDGDFTFLITLGKKHGLISGNDWGLPHIKHDFTDPDHMQRISLKDQTKLFNESWYPGESYNPYDNL